MKQKLFLAAAGLSAAATLQSAKPAQKQPNVLFICVDDLRTDLGCYRSSEVKTPHLDKLAQGGSLFFNHYVQIPTSGASRGSMLTGMLPRSRADLSNESCRTKMAGKAESNISESMFHQLKRNGYYTVGIGKISHYVDGLLYAYTEPTGTEWEMPHSWNEMLFNPGKWGTGWNAFFAYADGENRQSRKGQVKPYECAEVDDDGYPDGLTANLAVSKIQELAKRDTPFCLAVGFFKPHLPFNAPKKYWDLYDEASLAVTPAPDIPHGINRASLHNSNEFGSYKLGDENASLDHPVTDAYARKLRHAYYAATSYMDAQVGRVIDELKRQGLYDNTIVVVWGDHGWHLGDMQVWGKHTVFETALNSTLIVKAPNAKAGVENRRIVSSIDIYPTLMELCNIRVDYPLDGASFAKLLTKPNDKSWKEATYGYFANGISLRTPTYRLTRYFREQQPTVELYRYDTDKFERENIAAENPDVVDRLDALWQKGNTHLYD